MWHAGAIAKLMTSTLAIYCPPSNANRVPKVQLNDGGIVEEIGPNLSQFGGKNRWYGGILGVDGCVDAPLYAATGVLQIDPQTNSEVGYKFHGGLFLNETGVIYAF
jgi:hypothetical protein